MTNVPSYSTQAVAQHTIALLLEATNHAGIYDRKVQEGKWVSSSDPTFYIDQPLMELHGKTLGIIGYGSIGKEVGHIARAFGMKVQAYHPRKTAQESEREPTYVSLDQLLASSDIISLHAPLNEQTRGMISAKEFEQMKEGVILLNTSRGALTDEYALSASLRSGKVAFAGIDVLSEEPMRENHPLLGIPNCIITPHVAWAPVESRERLIRIACENIRKFLEGQPQNVVS